VVTPTVSVNQAMNAAARLDLRWTFQEMKNATVFLLDHFGDPQLFRASLGNNPSRVKHLPPASGIKRCAIQNDSRTRIRDSHADYYRIEFVQERIVIIEVLGHV
jgi:hypothetical protein